MARRRDTTQANYALRLQASLKAEAERIAEREGTTANQFINVAVAETLAALRTALSRMTDQDEALPKFLVPEAGATSRVRDRAGQVGHALLGYGAALGEDRWDG